MPKSGRRKFGRSKDSRTYKPRFVIVAEGRVTERQYFDCISRFRDVSTKVVVDCIRKKNSASSPSGVMQSMQHYLKENRLRDIDHAWLVVDKDHWEDQQIYELYEWSSKRENFGLALSNPNFEYWLLLHFEEAKGAISSTQCFRRLAHHLPDYDKGVPCRKIALSSVQQALIRAKKLDRSSSKWPKNAGSTMYRLVSLILRIASVQES